jgi:hypothetical protein
MKLKLVFLSLIVLFPMLSFAQSSITIFSEDGDKFYLVLNGQKQNTVAQTNVRIDGLSQPGYQAKIVFEDAAKPEITKNLPAQDPSTNAYADVTYKIKRTKDGDLKIRYFSATPVQQNYTPPADVYVMHYGQPAPVTNTVTQTTVTTTGNNPGDGSVSISFNGGGANMNMDVNDPNMQRSSVTQTTTTTSSATTDNSSYNAPRQAAPRGCQYPMDWSNFKSAKDAVAKATFEDTKLSTAKTILGSNCLSAEQVMQLCKLFSYEASKLDFAKTAYGKTTDPGNYFKVNNVFDFDASKTELNNYIANGGR